MTTQPQVTTVVRNLTTTPDQAFQTQVEAQMKTMASRFRSDLEADLNRLLVQSGFPAADQATVYTNVIATVKAVLW